MSLESFTAAYIECALWSSNDNTTEEGGEPLDNYSAEDIAPEALASMQSDCADFYEAFEELWADEYSDESAGHDFWLTRNGHGAGFWDRGLENGNQLTEMSKPYGGCDLYVGDDGRIYL